MSQVDTVIERLRRRYPKDKDVANLISCLQSARHVKIENWDDDWALIKQLEDANIKVDSALLEVVYLRIRRLCDMLTEEKIKEKPIFLQGYKFQP